MDFNEVWLYLIKIIIFIGACSLVGLISAMNSYFKSLNERVKTEKDYTNVLKDKALSESKLNKYSLTENIDGSNELMNLIITLITIETNAILNPLKTMNTKYTLTNIDTDIKAVSEKVFNGLNKDLIYNCQTSISTEYILTFITMETSNIFINAVIEHNASILS